MSKLTCEACKRTHACNMFERSSWRTVRRPLLLWTPCECAVKCMAPWAMPATSRGALRISVLVIHCDEHFCHSHNSCWAIPITAKRGPRHLQQCMRRKLPVPKCKVCSVPCMPQVCRCLVHTNCCCVVLHNRGSSPQPLDVHQRSCRLAP